MKKENLTSNFTKNKIILSAVGVALIGILEIVKVDKYMNIVKNPLAAGMSMMSNQQEYQIQIRNYGYSFQCCFLILAVYFYNNKLFSRHFKSKDF